MSHTRIHIIYIAFLTSMNNDKKITVLGSVVGIFSIALVFSILLIATATRDVMAQNLTTNTSSAVGNMTTSANQTGTAMANNVSNLVDNASKSANQTMTAMNKTGPSNNTAI